MRHIRRLHKGPEIIKQIEQNVEDFPDCALAWAITLARLGKSRQSNETANIHSDKVFLKQQVACQAASDQDTSTQKPYASLQS
jgi:hypothetical protein